MCVQHLPSPIIIVLPPRIYFIIELLDTCMNVRMHILQIQTEQFRRSISHAFENISPNIADSIQHKFNDDANEFSILFLLPQPFRPLSPCLLLTYAFKLHRSSIEYARKKNKTQISSLKCWRILAYYSYSVLTHVRTSHTCMVSHSLSLSLCHAIDKMASIQKTA